ncbi:MAG TPA: ABC transporter permease [Acetobacteraceae bacterium]|nr:ABC transporter permease [Acetobacteraceae bacterium]
MAAVWRAVLPPLALLIAVLVAWEAVIRLLHLPQYALPAPSAIAAVLVAKQASLAAAAWVTAGEVLVGFIVSGVVGAALALLIARFDRLGRAIYPLVVLFQTVPKIALAPLFVLWFGYGLLPKVVLIAVIAFFPVGLDMLAGLRAVDPNLVALMRSVGASRGQILWRVQVPTALPHLMSGLKIAVTLSVIGAIVGEFSGASAGLGYMIEFASTQLDTALVFAALVEVSVLGIVFYYLVELAERLLVPWSPR